MKDSNIAIIAGAIILGLAYYNSTESDRDAAYEEIHSTVPAPPQPSLNVVKGYNFKERNYREFTDDEIRAMRNENPDYIIKVPGRRILPKLDQHTRDMIESIDYDWDEIESAIQRQEDGPD